MNSAVFFYVPNIIGYVRVGIVVAAWLSYERLFAFLPLYLFSVVLDAVDGHVARHLNQTSAFGAWLDVWVDNISRSLLWTRLCWWGVIVACLEWTVFVCTHSLGFKWKEAFESSPWWVKAVMANGFYTFPGALTIAGIHGLPICLYLFQKQPDWVLYAAGWGEYLIWTALLILAVGRVIGAAVEVSERPLGWCSTVLVMGGGNVLYSDMVLCLLLYCCIWPLCLQNKFWCIKTHIIGLVENQPSS